MKISILKSEKFLLFFIFVATFLLRVPFLGGLKADPAVMLPIIDSLEFDMWAADILNGHLLWTTLQNHTPLYAYFLAAIYKTAGYNVLLVIIIQYLLASFSSILLYRIAKHLTNQRTAILAVILMSTYWFFIYVQSCLYSENLSVFLNLLLIHSLLFLRENLKKYLMCGIIFGLSVSCRPDILFFGIIILFWLRQLKTPGKMILKYYSLFLAGTAIILLPIMIHNCNISKDFTLLRTQVGANIYMGNNPDFKGTSIYVGLGKDWEDFISMPHQFFKREVKESESNQFFISQTLKIIRQKPIQWLQLMYEKLFSILTGRDFLRSEDVYFYNRHMAPTFFSLVSTPFIFILATTGLLISLSSWRKFLIIFLFIFSGSFLIFFQIKTRYLIPLIPFFIIFSAWCISSLFEAFKKRQWPKVFLIAGLASFLNLLSFFNPLKISVPTEAETFYAIGKNYALRQVDSHAVENYSRALEIDPQYLSVWNDLGLVWLNNGEYHKALKCFEKALQIDPAAVKPQLNYQLCQKMLKR